MLLVSGHDGTCVGEGRNPISILVLRHRVIGADGSPAGLADAPERKAFLLALDSPGCPAQPACSSPLRGVRHAPLADGAPGQSAAHAQR